MRRLLIVLALVTGALVPVTGALAAAPPSASPANAGSIGIRLVDAPTDRQDDPRARIYVIDHIEPGASIERRIEVSNTTGETQKVSVYAAGAAIADGSFMGSEAQTQNELSTWTTLDQDTVDLAADSTGIVTVTIAVPATASTGEQYAVVWAEARSAPPAGGGVTVVNRVGIRLYIDVGPGGEAPSAFTITELTAARLENGQPMVSAIVTNTGGRALDMGGTLTLANGPGGLSAGPFDASLGTTLAPGDTEPVTIALDERLPNGPWDAHLELTSGLLTGTADATITFPDAGSAAAVTAVPADGFPPWAIAVIALAVLALLALLLLFFLRRRRSGDEDDDPSALPAPDLTPVGAPAR